MFGKSVGLFVGQNLIISKVFGTCGLYSNEVPVQLVMVSFFSRGKNLKLNGILCGKKLILKRIHITLTMDNLKKICQHAQRSFQTFIIDFERLEGRP